MRFKRPHFRKLLNCGGNSSKELNFGRSLVVKRVWLEFGLKTNANNSSSSSSKRHTYEGKLHESAAANRAQVSQQPTANSNAGRTETIVSSNSIEPNRVGNQSIIHSVSRRSGSIAQARRFALARRLSPADNGCCGSLVRKLAAKRKLASPLYTIHCNDNYNERLLPSASICLTGLPNFGERSPLTSVGGSSGSGSGSSASAGDLCAGARNYRTATAITRRQHNQGRALAVRWLTQTSGRSPLVATIAIGAEWAASCCLLPSYRRQQQQQQ